MSRHRPGDIEPPVTAAYVPAEDDDLRGLAREASAGLTATAQAADDRLDEVADSAAKAARRGLLLALIAVSVVLLASIALNLYTLQSATTSAGQIAALTAGDAADSTVADARQTNLVNARASLTRVNQARTAAGLVPVPDPGLSATANLVDNAAAAGLGDLLTLGTLQSKGQVIPGVSAPSPTDARFPWFRAAPR